MVLAAVAWLIRSLVNHLLSKDVEAYKQKLANEAATELERLKHELRLAAVVHEKQTQILHERRAKVIAELYKRLVRFIGAAGSFASLAEWVGEPSKDEKAKVLGEKAWEFREYFLHNRIYFSREVCDKLDSIFQDIHGASSKYRVMLAHSRSESVSEQVHEAWLEAWDLMSKKVPALRDAIDNEFRALLGVK